MTADTKRIFIGIFLNDAAHGAIDAYVNRLKENVSSDDFRFMPAENWHVTLRFLGDISEDKIGEVRDTIKNALPAQSNFEITFNLPIIFPNNKHPSVLALQAACNPALIEFTEKLNHALNRNGCGHDKQSFRPHLSLARVRQRHAVINNPAPFEYKMPVEHIVLVQSETLPEGAKYTVLKRFALS